MIGKGVVGWISLQKRGKGKMPIISTLPFSYVDSRELRAISLEKDGIRFMPGLVYSHFAKSKPYVDVHRHPGCIEIAFCHRGLLCFELDGHPFELRPGYVLLIQPEVPHHLISNQQGMIMYGAFLRMDLEGPILHLPEKESEVLLNKLTSIPSSIFYGGDEIRKLFDHLFDIVDKNESGISKTLYLRSAVLDLILALCQASKNKGEHKKSKARLEELVHEIMAHPEKDFSIPKMASSVALSESMIYQEMKKLTGLPPYAFVKSCRMKRALELIQTKDLSITELALKFHFSSPQHFSTQFSKFFGITPSQARKGVPPVSK